jgi:hypothetical protein
MVVPVINVMRTGFRGYTATNWKWKKGCMEMSANKCPYCGAVGEFESFDLIIDREDGKVYEYCACYICDKQFTFVYELKED